MPANGEPAPRYPITGIAGCCPRAAIGHADRRAAEQGDELAAADHSMTSSARANNFGGTSRPSVLAAFRLITKPNLVA